MCGCQSPPSYGNTPLHFVWSAPQGRRKTPQFIKVDTDDPMTLSLSKTPSTMSRKMARIVKDHATDVFGKTFTVGHLSDLDDQYAV